MTVPPPDLNKFQRALGVTPAEPLDFPEPKVSVPSGSHLCGGGGGDAADGARNPADAFKAYCDDIKSPRQAQSLVSKF